MFTIEKKFSDSLKYPSSLLLESSWNVGYTAQHDTAIVNVYES